MAVGGDGGGKVNDGRIRKDCPVGRESQRDDGSIVCGQGNRVNDLAGIVALESVGIVSGDGKVIGVTGDQVGDGDGGSTAHVNDIGVGSAGCSLVKAISGNRAVGAGIPSESHTALSASGDGEREDEQRRSKPPHDSKEFRQAAGGVAGAAALGGAAKTAGTALGLASRAQAVARLGCCGSN